jgi:hypothetical protein
MISELADEGDVNWQRVALVELESRARKAEQPGIAGVLADDKNYTVGIGCGRRAVRKGARSIVAERAADPVSDMDRAERSPCAGAGGNRRQHDARRQTTLEHQLSPQPQVACRILPILQK